MKFNILTLFPDFFKSVLNAGLIQRAIQKSLLQVNLVDIKHFVEKGRADDYPFGGGDGMLISYPPLKKSLKSISSTGHVIYLSAQGQLWSSKKAKSYSKKYQNITLICGRYGGVDSRFVQDFVDEEVCIGDYILNGGEAASLVLMESISRFLPGFLGNEESAQKESFENGLLEGPGWTKPRYLEGHKIPEVIFSGHHQKIKTLRFYTALLWTHLKRADLLKGNKKLLDQLPLAEQYLLQMPLEELKTLGFCKKETSLALLEKIEP